MPVLLPKQKRSSLEHELIAECLRKACTLVDAFDDGLEPVVDPRTNPHVNVEEMASRWQWAMLALIDHYDISTNGIRRLADVIARESQDSLWSRSEVRNAGRGDWSPEPT